MRLIKCIADAGAKLEDQSDLVLKYQVHMKDYYSDFESVSKAGHDTRLAWHQNKQHLINAAVGPFFPRQNILPAWQGSNGPTSIEEIRTNVFN